MRNEEMTMSSGMPRPELLQVADAVAREKGIDRDEVLTAMVMTFAPILTAKPAKSG